MATKAALSIQPGARKKARTSRGPRQSSDLALLPENGARYEIINGDLLMSRSPHWQHQETCGNVLHLVGTLLPEETLTSPLPPGFSCLVSSLFR
jgi:hypothetical protein